MKTLTHAILAPAMLLASSMAAAAATPAENVATAQAFIQALDSGTNPLSMVGANYTEHQQNSGFTLEGMAALVPKGAEMTIHRTLAEADKVFLHIEQTNPEAVLARGDLFRFDDAGKIVEHWGVLQAAVPASETKSGHSMFDGVTNVNFSSTLATDHAAAHLAATNRIFNNMDSEAVFASVTPDYIQHNPSGVNGPEGLAGTLVFLQSQNIALHKELKQTVVVGDFIVKLNYYSTTPVIPLFGNAIVFDIIRFAEDGRAAEHWDIAEEITDPEQIDTLF